MTGRRSRLQQPIEDDPVAIYDAWRAGRIRQCPTGFWQIEANARAVLEALWEREGIPMEEVPHRCRQRWFKERVGTLNRLYRGSPYLLLTSLYPSWWQPSDFPELPKADDLQEAAFAQEGLDRDPDPMRRWALSQKLRSDRQGKCRICNRLRDTDTIYCSYHLSVFRQRQRQRYAEWREQGLCYRCGGRPAVKAGACQPCYQRILINRAREMRRHYWRNKAQGLCCHWKCNAPAIPGQTLCEKHRQEERQRYYRLNYREKARINRQRRRDKEAPATP